MELLIFFILDIFLIQNPVGWEGYLLLRKKGVYTGSLLPYFNISESVVYYMKTRLPIECAKNGIPYSRPYDMNEDIFYSLLDELLTFCKIKRLTVKQAQILFKTCIKYVSDSTLV